MRGFRRCAGPAILPGFSFRPHTPSEQIDPRLLEDAAGRNQVQAAHEQQEEKQSLEWLASNMVSWFSQRITVGKSDWSRAFERTKIDGLWAYKRCASPYRTAPSSRLLGLICAKAVSLNW